MRINNQGLINWNPAGIYLVSCSSDITYYPLDQQVCTVKVSTWGYTTNEIFLVYDTQPVELGFYSENGEWELVGAVGEPTQDRARGGQSFSSLSFSITLRRRPLFHALNTILPVVLMAFLIPMVYRLPVDSGEKIGYSLTVLLAYAVYLTLISDNIPSTSVSVCYLSKHILQCNNLIIVFIDLYKLEFSTESNFTPCFTFSCVPGHRSGSWSSFGSLCYNGYRSLSQGRQTSHIMHGSSWSPHGQSYVC